jgi:hypothetical protein
MTSRSLYLVSPIIFPIEEPEQDAGSSTPGG